MKFKKERCQRSGIPFWDHSFNAYISFDYDGKRVCIGAFDLAKLKKLLNKDFDARTGQWKIIADDGNGKEQEKQ